MSRWVELGLQLVEVEIKFIYLIDILINISGMGFFRVYADFHGTEIEIRG